MSVNASNSTETGFSLIPKTLRERVYESFHYSHTDNPIFRAIKNGQAGLIPQHSTETRVSE